LPRSFQRKVYLKITELYLWEIPYLHFQGNCTFGVAILFQEVFVCLRSCFLKIIF
jgi:hypothetical protein